MEVGPTGAQFGHSDPADTRYAARFDGKEIVRRCAAAGSDYVVVWARDGDYAYYDSAVLPKAPGLGRRDVLREAVEEGRRRGLPVIAYCVVQQGGHFLRQHPELEMRDAQNRPLGRFCLNSGYLEWMKRITAEQLAYGIAGFHIDMLDQGFGPPYGCWCGTCQRLFQAEHGRPLPGGATWDEDWDRMLQFRYDTSARFMRALRGHIRRLDPRATVDFNYHGNPSFSFETGQRPVQHAGQGDFITGETGAWGFSALTVGLNARFYRAAAPGQRVQVAMQRGVRMYHDQTTRPLADLRWELLTLLSHGAFATLVDKTGLDGSLDPAAYDRIGRLFRDAHARRSHFGHAPVEEAALYFSSRTRDWVGRDRPGEWFRSFLGAHKALAYAHIPWGVLLDENASLERLRRHRVVVLCNAGILTPGEVERLTRYVEGGGGLIVTGWTGLHGARGEPQSGSAISRLIGGEAQARLDSLDNWVRLPAGAVLSPGIRPSWPFLVKGPAVVYRPTTAVPVGELMRPHRTTRQKEGKEGTEWPMSPDSPAGPAALINRVGRGRVVAFACSPDYAAASEHHIVEARRLLVNAVRLLDPDPRVRIEAPAFVEAVVTEQPAARILRVHLVAYAPPAQTMPAANRPYVLPALMEDRPLFRVRLTLPAAPRSVEAFCRSTVVRCRGRTVEVLVADVHEVVVLRLA